MAFEARFGFGSVSECIGIGKTNSFHQVKGKIAEVHFGIYPACVLHYNTDFTIKKRFLEIFVHDQNFLDVRCLLHI